MLLRFHSVHLSHQSNMSQVMSEAIAPFTYHYTLSKGEQRSVTSVSHGWFTLDNQSGQPFFVMLSPDGSMYDSRAIKRAEYDHVARIKLTRSKTAYDLSHEDCRLGLEHGEQGVVHIIDKHSTHIVSGQPTVDMQSTATHFYLRLNRPLYVNPSPEFLASLTQRSAQVPISKGGNYVVTLVNNQFTVQHQQ